MKNLFIALIAVFSVTQLYGQKLTKDVEAVYNQAEKLKSKKDYNKAIETYKDVLRSVNHVPSMVAIGDIDMILRPRPNYRNAATYYNMAVEELNSQISAVEKKKQKAKLGKYLEEVIPKRNKAQSYTDDFDKAKEQRQGGSNLIDKE